MSDEFDFADELIRDYPDLCGNVYCGIECPLGWQPIVRRLCREIVKIDPGARCAQIKPKLGELRFYLNSATDEAHELTNKATRESWRVCEDCGASEGVERKRIGNPYTGWIRTLCPLHRSAAAAALEFRLRQYKEGTG